jgi:hypothetical protein
MKDRNKVLSILFALLIGFSFGRFIIPQPSDEHLDLLEHHETAHHDSVDRESMISMKNEIIGKNITDEKYKCCLEIPCTYCIEKTPGHGEGDSCLCLEDIVNGKHPCGECIGEILEGHGNRFLAKYFAKAIAEEVGVEYEDTLKQIMFDKYGIAIEEQV